MTGETLLILNGPGNPTNSDLQKIEAACVERCNALSVKLDFRQANAEEEVHRRIVRDSDNYDALIVSPSAGALGGNVGYEACRAAIEAIMHLNKPVIEVHIENMFRSEVQSLRPLQVPEGGLGLVCGLGVKGYLLAIDATYRQLMSRAA